MATRHSPEALIAQEEIRRVRGAVFEEWSGIASFGIDGGYSYHDFLLEQSRHFHRRRLRR